LPKKKVGYKVNKFLEGHLGKSAIEEEDYRGTAHQISHITGFPGKSFITIFINGARTSQTYDPSLIDFPFLYELHI